MTTADDDYARYGQKRDAPTLGCIIVLLLGLGLCGIVWVAIDGKEMIDDLFLEAREAPAGNAAFAPARDEILAIFPPGSLQQIIAEHSGKIEWTYSCYEVEAEWLVPFDRPSDEFPRRFQSSDGFSGWSYSEYRNYAYPYYQFRSKDDKLSLTITYAEAGWSKPNLPAGYEVWLTYRTPSQSDCHA